MPKRMLSDYPVDEDILKKFATSLLVYAGPLAYDCLYENLPKALPSLRSIQCVRGLSQIIFPTVSVIMTLRGGLGV